VQGARDVTPPAGASGRTWPTTLWSLIRQGREGDTEERKAAREHLCRLYYQPVFRFFQKVLQVGPADVEDVTQDYFTRFVEKDFLHNVTHEKSFRGFLKLACRRHFINWLESRRSSGVEVPLEAADTPPERIDSMIDEEVRAWTLEEAVARLKKELLGQGKGIQFQVFEARAGLDGLASPGYRELAAGFGMSVYDVGNHLAAARRLLRKILLDLASERADNPSDELRDMGLQDFLH